MTGKIYIIRNKNDENLIYIGSTFADLNYRFNRHKFQHTTALHKYIIDNNDDWDNWNIELFAEYEDISKEDLLKKEGDIIRSYILDNPSGTLNKCIAGRTRQEYIQDNKEKINAIRKRYYYNHIDRFKQSFICECGRSFRTDNKYRHLKSKYHSCSPVPDTSRNGTSTTTTSAEGSLVLGNEPDERLVVGSSSAELINIIGR